MKDTRALAAIATVALPLVSAWASGDVQAQPATEKHPMTGPSASRPSAPVVPALEHLGVRYAQDSHDDRAGDQPGGYLVAIDAKSGQRLWRLKVYEVPDQRAAGRPAMARYFRSMRLSPNGDSLEIENESGGVYRVDLASRNALQTGGPAASAPAPRPVLPPKALPQ